MRTIPISRITQDQFKEVIEEFGFQLRSRPGIGVTPTSESIRPFEWDDRKEDARANDYMEWLNDNITPPKGTQFYKASSDIKLLNSAVASSKYKFSGTLDAAIVNDAYIETGFVVSGILVGIEVKKNVTPKNNMQAILELLIAGLSSEYSVVNILTDLRDVWRFFWLEQGLIVSCQLKRLQAVNFIESTAEEISSGMSVPSSLTKNKCTLRDAVSGGSRMAHETAHETAPAEGLAKILKRPKVDVMSMLPEDDVGDMRDVFEVMSPDEILQWKIKRVTEQVFRAPGLQSLIYT